MFVDVFVRKPHALFEAGRESLWHGEAPLQTDGSLLDDLLEAQDKAAQGIQELREARKAPIEFVDRDLADAEKLLRESLALISTLRTAIAAVPADFGEVA